MDLFGGKLGNWNMFREPTMLGFSQINAKTAHSTFEVNSSKIYFNGFALIHELNRMAIYLKTDANFGEHFKKLFSNANWNKHLKRTRDTCVYSSFIHVMLTVECDKYLSNEFEAECIVEL